MASNNPPRLRRDCPVRRSTTLSSPVTPQPSAISPLRPLGDIRSDYLAINASNHDENASRSSFGSSTPLLQERQPPASPSTSSVQTQNNELGSTTRPVLIQQPTASPAETNQRTITQSTMGQQTRTQSGQNGSASPEAAPPAANPPLAKINWKEWKSWKIRWPWLSFLLFTVMSLIIVIAILEIISRRNSGFVRQTKVPAFFAHNPALERAIWSQGILYTAFPAFIMTVYRTMWESAVAAFADRQPYVDLRKSGGRTPRSTIMLDYKTKPIIYGWLVAVRNGHFLLGACMFFSVILALLVVPLASFLFTTTSFVSNATFPLSFTTSFNEHVLGDNLSYPDVRLSLDSAAAMRLLDARGPPWTDGEHAFAKFVPQVDVGDDEILLETTAYSAQSGCRYIPESQYQKTILTPNDTGIPSLSIRVTADDRGCPISNYINPSVRLGHPENFITIWPTMSCAADAGWSRFSILTARYTNASTGVTNFSLISCAPSYWITPGTLLTTTGTNSLRSFAPHLTNTSEFRPMAIWRFFEMQIQSSMYFDPVRNVESNEFGQYVYKMATKAYSASPLLPEGLIDVTQTLFSTTFAVFASTALFKPRPVPLNSTGIHMIQETRLIVVSPIAYIILGVLVVVVFLNVCLFFYARQESMLFEEPIGLLSFCGILYNSDVHTMIGRLAEEPDFDGKTTETTIKKCGLERRLYRFDEGEKRIVCRTIEPQA
jgi:hypothetical protein